MNVIVIEKDHTKVGSVAAWQNILNGCGYNPELIITGYMDDATTAATKRFQKDLGLAVTGTVDLKTWAAGLNHKKLPGWSEATPLVSVRRNPDPASDIIWSTDATANVRWSKTELTQQLIKKAKELGLTLKTQWAYMMATIQWETADTFEPVREAFWLSENWRSRNLRYYPYYGRGYVQLTWEDNYEKYSGILGLPLVTQPDLAMKPGVALYILVHGFKHGIFTGFKLEEFVNSGKTDYYRARQCINGMDKAKEIKAIAQEWENIL
jgi:hypothetical protein